ncbi:MAG: hypothetical protein SH856_00120 [Flavobacteriales bacterium]|nr:hypothetical protein [Flavobacteriales bacterium]
MKNIVMDGIAAGAIILAGQLMITIDFQWVNKGQEKQSQHLQPSSAIETSHETKAYSLNGYYIFM